MSFNSIWNRGLKDFLKPFPVGCSDGRFLSCLSGYADSMRVEGLCTSWFWMGVNENKDKSWSGLSWWKGRVIYPWTFSEQCRNWSCTSWLVPFCLFLSLRSQWNEWGPSFLCVCSWTMSLMKFFLSSKLVGSRGEVYLFLPLSHFTTPISPEFLVPK